MSDTSNTFDPDAYKPRQIEGVEAYDRGTGEPAARYALTTETIRDVAILSEEEKALWDMFDGELSVNDICVKYLEEQRSLVLSQAYALIERLWEYRLLRDDPCLSTSSSERKITDQASFGLRLPLPGTGAIARIPGSLFKLFRVDSYMSIIVVVAAIAIGCGLISGLRLDPLFRFRTPIEGTIIGYVSNTYGYGLALMVVIGIIASFVRELVVTAVQGSMTGRYPSLYVGIYGMPSFHNPRKWRKTLPARQRLVASFAGLAFELLLASICGLLLYMEVALGAFGIAITFKIMYVLLIRSFLHLSPFAGSDLHAIMDEWIRIPNFRRKALSFLRHKFMETLTMSNQMCREHRFFLVYVLSSAGWILLVTKLGQVVLAEDYILKSDMLNLFSVWFGDNKMPGETDQLFVVVLLLFLVPVLLSCVVSIFYIFYFVWCFVSQQPLFKNPNMSLFVGSVLVTAYILSATYFIESDPYIFKFKACLGAICLVLGGLFMTYTVVRDGPSPTAIQLGATGIAAAVGGIIVIDIATVNSTVPWEILIVLFLLPQILAVLVKKQFSFLWRTSAFTFPIWVFIIGLGLLVVGCCYQFNLLVDLDGLGRLRCDFIAMSLIALSAMLYRAHLRDPKLEADLLVLDKPDGDPAASLTIIFNELQQNIGQILRSTCGSFANTIAADVKSKGFSFDKRHDFDGDTSEKLAGEIRTILTGINAGITRYFGEAYSDTVFHTAFGKLNYQCYLLLHEHVLSGTRFEITAGAPTTAKCLESYEGINFFQGLSTDDRVNLGQRMVLQHYPSNALLVQSGDDADSCYIIIDGRAQVEDVDLVGDGHILAFLNPGDFLGESALLENSVRMANVRTVTPTTVLSLYRQDVDALGVKRPQILETIKRQMEIMHFLFNIRLFADLPSVLVRSVIPKIAISRYKDGETVFKKGDEGDLFYLIQSGGVSIIDETKEGEKEVAKLGEHDYFGEIALIKNVPRAMTARCVGDTEVLLLEKDVTLQLIEGSKLFAANINRVGETRMEAVGLS